MVQTLLFGGGPPAFDPSFRGIRRIEIGLGAWIEHLPGWLSGHEEVFAELRDRTAWQASKRQMYERVVDVPRLTARIPEHGAALPVMHELSDALTARYGRPLTSMSMAYYRDGRDSVAPHGDRLPIVPAHLPGHKGAGRRDDAVVAIVSVGSPRKFLLRRQDHAKRSLGPARERRDLRVFQLGWGDLLVMGGTCQATFEHGVPKCAHAEPRVSVMFREEWG